MDEKGSRRFQGPCLALSTHGLRLTRRKVSPEQVGESLGMVYNEMFMRTLGDDDDDDEGRRRGNESCAPLSSFIAHRITIEALPVCWFGGW